jgi:hypothetical protein
MHLDVKTRYYCPTKGCKNRYYSSSGPKECSECKKVYDPSKYKTETRRYFVSRKEAHLIPQEN